MNNSVKLNLSKSVFIQIIRSNVTVYLIPYGTSLITTNSENDLILNPGKYSIDPDSNLFDENVIYFKFFR
jgi:hypothetical protein